MSKEDRSHQVCFRRNSYSRPQASRRRPFSTTITVLPSWPTTPSGSGIPIVSAAIASTTITPSEKVMFWMIVASEVVREALRLMVEHDKRMKITAMRDAAIAEGIAAADRGDKVELTREVWNQIMAEADSMSDEEPLDPLVTGEL